MSAQSRIPLTFNVSDPKRLRADLERQSATLEAYHATLTGPQQAAVVVRKPVKSQPNATTASFGQWTPIDLPNDTDVIRVSLPRPDPRFAGLSAYILRRTATGTIRVSAPGATINGFDAVELASAVGLYELFFDGEGYFTAPGAAWGVP